MQDEVKCTLIDSEEDFRVGGTASTMENKIIIWHGFDISLKKYDGIMQHSADYFSEAGIICYRKTE